MWCGLGLVAYAGCGGFWLLWFGFGVCYVWWFDDCVVWGISVVFCVVGVAGCWFALCWVCNLVVLCIMGVFGL